MLLVPAMLALRSALAANPPRKPLEQPWVALPLQVMLLCGADVLASLTVPGVWEAPDALLRVSWGKVHEEEEFGERRERDH